MDAEGLANHPSLSFSVHWDKRKKERRVWVHPYLLHCQNFGHCDNLMWKLAEEDLVLYRNFIQLDKDLLNDTVEWLWPRTEKQTTWWREPLDISLCVTVTLRFLVTDNSYKSLGTEFCLVIKLLATSKE